MLYFLATIVLDHAHLASPIVMAWTNRRFRNHMLERPAKFILLPILCLSAAVWIGAHYARHDLIFEALLLTYGVWNFLHFCMQNYGLVRVAGGRQWLAEVIMVATAVALLLPLVLPTLWVAILIGVVSLLHWVTAIGLAAIFGRWRWWLLGAVFVVGLFGFLWEIVIPTNDLPRLVMTGIPLWMAIRAGISFAHFLYDRWIWPRSSREMFA